MKTLYKSLSILALILLVFGLNSCEKINHETQATGSFELFLSLDEQGVSGLKSVVPDSLEISPYHALLTVIGPDSMPVLENELLPLYKFGDGFFSKRIELKVGRYRLMEFLIVNPEGEVIFAAPLEGSPKAYLVKDPLPIGFRISPEETTRLSPEVLPVQGEPPSKFGYSSFGFNVVKPLPFFIAVMIDDPMIMAPALFTDAYLRVFHPDGWSHDFYLEGKVNRVVIRGGAEYYKIIVEKKGSEPVKMEISARRLLATTADQPLIVRLGPGHMVLRLQPGPEDGFDAMISNLDPDQNFGKHPYFEATFISEPLLTVMRENRSLIRFSPTGLPKSARIERAILTLFYDLPVPWDSIYKDSVYYLSPERSDFAWFGGVLQQIVEPWQEHEVTWNNQPKTIDANQVYVNPFIKNANFIEVDVTKLFVPEQEIAAPNYGMLFKLAPSPQFPGFRFTSSDYKEPNMRPMLKIFYTIPLD
ncbi:DNRLRE domain-containing protein [Bacteroidota bacterium]